MQLVNKCYRSLLEVQVQGSHVTNKQMDCDSFKKKLIPVIIVIKTAQMDTETGN